MGIDSTDRTAMAGPSFGGISDQLSRRSVSDLQGRLRHILGDR